MNNGCHMRLRDYIMVFFINLLIGKFFSPSDVKPHISEIINPLDVILHFFHVVQASPKLKILLPQPPECLDFIHAPLHQAKGVQPEARWDGAHLLSQIFRRQRHRGRLSPEVGHHNVLCQLGVHTKLGISVVTSLHGEYLCVGSTTLNPGHCSRTSVLKNFCFGGIFCEIYLGQVSAYILPKFFPFLSLSFCKLACSTSCQERSVEVFQVCVFLFLYLVFLVVGLPFLIYFD